MRPYEKGVACGLFVRFKFGEQITVNREMDWIADCHVDDDDDDDKLWPNQTCNTVLCTYKKNGKLHPLRESGRARERASNTNGR